MLTLNLSQALVYISQLYRPALILRGVPGSGKSGLVQALRKEYGADLVHCSADNYRVKDGSYVFDRRDNQKFHGMCLKAYIEAAPTNREILVCDNTNTTVAEVAPYVSVAQAYERSPTVLTFVAPPEVAFARGRHGVPLDKIRHMARRLEDASKRFPSHWNHVEVFTGDVL